ncbi:MAG: hypothetical protein WB473_16825, partial [Pedococcus sp.]
MSTCGPTTTPTYSSTHRTTGNSWRTHRAGRRVAGVVALALALWGTAGSAQAATAHNPAPQPAGSGVQRSAVSTMSPVRRTAPVAPTLDAAAKAAVSGSTTTQLLPAAGSAAAAGALAPSGCTTSGTDVACD